jgi:hypothetical protein
VSEGEAPGETPRPDHYNPDDSTAAATSFYEENLDLGGNLRALRFDSDVQEILRKTWERDAARGATERARQRVAPYRQKVLADLIHGDGILELPSPRSLVGDLFQLDSLAVIYGPPSSGKTFLAMDIALSVATRRSWQGKEVVDGPVLYVGAEDAAGIAKRARAWRARYGELGEIHWLLQRVPLLDSGAVGELCDKVADVAPALIVVDTLTRCMVGADENSTREMGLAVDALDRLRTVIGSCVVTIHHSGKDGSRGPRGSIVLLTAADTAVECRRTRSGITAVVEKQKNGPDGQRLHFSLDPQGDSAVLVGSALPGSEDGFRPTVLMERVSRYLEGSAEANLRAVRGAIQSNAGYVDKAVRCLIDEGFVTTSTGPRGAILHRSVTPFRDDNGDAA